MPVPARSRTSPKPGIAVEEFFAADMRVARVLAAPLASGTRAASRVLRLDLGHLGERTSVAQLAMVAEQDLVGRNVVACINLGARRIGKYDSQALVLGCPHPDGPPGEAQALALYAPDSARPGDEIF